MTLQEFAQQLVRFSFLAMAGLTFLDYVRRPNRTRLEISLLFGCFAPSLLWQALPETVRSSFPWASTLGSLAIVAHPYLLLRLVNRLRNVPPIVIHGSLVGMLLSWGLLVLFPPPLPGPATLLIVAYFGLAEGYATVALLRGAASRRGLSRRRLQLAAAGSGWLAIVILLAGVAVVLPRVSAVTAPAGQALAILSVLSYYAGFTPPRFVRRFWQLGEVYQFMRQASGRSPEHRLSQLLDTLCPAATRAVGGVGSMVWLGADGAGLTYRKADIPVPDPAAVGRLQDTLNQPGGPIDAEMQPVETWRGGSSVGVADPLGAAWLEIVPIAEPGRTWGVLIVLLRHESLFPEDDLELLTLMAEQTAAGLAGEELFREQKELAGTLEDVNADLQRQIKERERAEAEVRALNQELEGRIQEREAAYDELEAFSYSVSHDLRAPLRTIHGFARILMEEHGPALPDDGRRYVRLIDEGARQLGTLIDELLDFSRLGRQSLQRRGVETAGLVRDVVDRLRRENPDRDLTFAVGDLPPCDADPPMIRSVWSNLLSNAVKFTRPRARA
ncbi:MAG: sensor histidine kinase, partial [Anaerolineales bacterium]